MDKVTSEEFLITLLLSYFRIVSFLFTFPFYGSFLIPNTIRLYLAFALSFAVLSFINITPVKVNTFVEFLVYALNELLFGFSAGLILRLLFDALIIAGELIALHTGLGFLQMFIPGMTQMSLFSGFFTLYGTLIFLSLGGGEFIILGLAESFKRLPVGSFNIFYLNPEVFLNFFYESFRLGVKIAMPLILTALILNLVLAVVNRFIPQMNVFMVGLPLQVSIGLIILLLSLPLITITMSNHFQDFFKVFEYFIQSFKSP
ncbi:flagellar biosynthetic protein FliR [Aquifex aeolicus]|uniref:Flagellar biosynthetic protein FliR n=1 Tax=Aquifex aeolicus (strain VF5) TaxID=224324 RepID=FLIR_AQUAE|nr:flagellar biosynthetic protein FliR [Aquifex aeolicus]O67773.1 RecName: Full=Flagellar biosynthetic protein FliR [Aquifex aeolicus VF5]AAC07732.1 flagellar biosynthetic protein FliR [Aquifex aeolicus VF5]